MMLWWTRRDLDELQDEIMKAEALDEIEIVEEEYNLLFEVAQNYPNLIDLKKFTFEIFMDAFVLSVTRAFGYSLPYLMICPLADCANHHVCDIQYELFNERLTRKGQHSAELNEDERNYFTPDKRRINFLKHFEEQPIDEKVNIPYKSARYVKKVQMRNTIRKIKLEEFMKSDEYQK